MSIYDEITPAVRDAMALAKQGTIALVSVTPGTGPVDDPGEPVEISHNLDAVARGVSFKYVQGGLADASDLQVTFAASLEVPDPKLSDWVTIDGIRHKVVQVLPKPAGGTPLVFTLIVRR